MSVEELLPAYIAGELSAQERVRVEEALAGSRRLREELARYERLFVLLSAAASEEVRAPSGLRSSVMRRVTLIHYLDAAAGMAEDLLGAYGWAIVYYLRLN